MSRSRFVALASLGAALSLTALVAACGGAAPTPTAAPAKPAATTAPAAPAATSAAPAATKPAAAPAATSAPAAAATKPAASAPALTKEYKMSLATGGTAGTYFPLGGALASLWTKSIPGVSVTAETTGASVENMRLLGNKQVELALTQNDIADYAFNGTEFFKEKIGNVRAIGAIYPELIQLVVTPSIKSFEEIKGKRIVMGPPGSGTEANTRQIVESNGMKYSDFSRALFLANNEAAAAMKDRQVDGMFQTSGVPMPAITDVATTQEITILPLDGQIAKNVMDKYKFFVPAKIPANSYKGQTQEINTIAVLACLVTREDMDADLVYWLTKTIVEKQPELAQAHAKGKDVSKESIVKGLTIPWHPGAERYYKEAGILK